MPKETGLPCTAEMIGAYLGGRKTVTRRLWGLKKINAGPDVWEAIYQDGGGNWIAWSNDSPGLAEFTKKAYPNGEGFKCPYGGVGDLLWVREAHWIDPEGDIYYRADWIDPRDGTVVQPRNSQWRSSRFMFKKHARIWQEIIDLRPERLWDITPEDCKAEGIHGYTFARGCCSENPPDQRWAFIDLWDSINPKYPWRTNCWVWRIESKRIER